MTPPNHPVIVTVERAGVSHTFGLTPAQAIIIANAVGNRGNAITVTEMGNATTYNDTLDRVYGLASALARAARGES